LIICSEWVLPITSPLIRDGAVCIKGSLISSVGTRQEVLMKNPYDDILDFGNAVTLPGLVNCHTHLRDTLWRGTVDDQDFTSWQKGWVDMVHRMPRRLTEEELYYSCNIGLCEAIKSGTTCFADISGHGYSLKSLIESKIRGVCFLEAHDQIGTLIPESRNPKKETDSVLEETRKETENRLYIAKSTLIDVGIAPHAPYSASPDLIKGLAHIAREMKLRLSIHLSECKEEAKFIKKGDGIFGENARRSGIEWTPRNKSPVEYLASLNFLGEDVLAVHCTHLTDTDIRILAETKTGVAHNPVSNAKLANGVAPILKMLQRGVKVGLGTDGAQTNNSLNMFETMKYAILLQRAIHEKPVLTAQRTLQLATIEGAETLGLDHLIGSLEKGKRADLIVVNLGTSKTKPTYDPVSSLVYTSSCNQVEFVIVDGKILIENGKILTIDEENALKKMERIEELVEENGNSRI